LDARDMAEWLHASPDFQHGQKRSAIVRFLDPSEYRQFWHVLQHHPAYARMPAKIRRLGIINAISCPLPPDGLPSIASGRLTVEEDEAVSLHALPSGSFVSDKGIPWGVKHIGAPRAWSRTTGYRVKVGVIDTGVDFGHPDLQHALERGINLLQRMSLPLDDNGHGTHIAGTIAAGNRLHGMIGVAPRATVYPVKAFDHNGTAYVSDIILGIEWCVRHGMNVVNMSFGMKTRSRSLLAAVNNAYQAGVLIVASSGNEGLIGTIDYPARYSQTIAVGATNRRGKIAGFTNRSSMIDIYAPGERIVSAWLRGRHREMSGTSMATSHVTGAIALLMALKPRLTPAQIKAIILKSAAPLRSGKTPRAAGELSVTRMIKAADNLGTFKK